MSGAPFSRRFLAALLRTGRTVAVALALLAFVHVTLPHPHAAPAEERHCPVCQVSRHDGTGVPEPRTVDLAPPDGVDAQRVVLVAERPRAATLAAPLPSRGPPSHSPSEPL